MKLNTPTIILFTIFLSVVISSCEKNYLEYSQHIKSLDGKFNYCLYLDNVGIGDDPGYYILKLNKSINPKKLYVKWSSDNGIKAEDSEWLRSKQILFNYDEAGFLTSNPKLEIINNRHLVFSRGGYYFGLYDIKTEKDTFNIGSPWNEWKAKSNYKSEKYDRDIEEIEYRMWIKQNIDRRIRNYIEANK